MKLRKRYRTISYFIRVRLLSIRTFILFVLAVTLRKLTHNPNLWIKIITADFDLLIIGGGINGTGIARDAQGRGLRVGLAEMNDLASATSSASTKLFHGGLRYLEIFEFKLVRNALIEREVLLSAMPHISWPMRFVLLYHKDMRFEGTHRLQNY